jgi:hypothetical protein
MTEATSSAPPPRAPEKIGPGVAARMDTGGIILRRWAGAWIDFVAMGAIVWLFILLGAAIEVQPMAGAAVLTGYLAVLAYFPVTEGLWGRSAGKFVTGTIVVVPASSQSRGSIHDAAASLVDLDLDRSAPAEGHLTVLASSHDPLPDIDR